ncbi:6-hydroxymethylpterin diphosphokinase MptE-like protein [Alteromonas facilis]|uniref:motility associated factor glycosyltransferase family protein n=1 Tax=Alteromonas facilis TaxID=2048004 RepID=UPI000C290AAE|nr:6-hydroxymethylpterin diphosphokinase MptE-like protein [Alteromonas facilis]
MLDNIRTHLHEDESAQLEIEKSAAEALQSTFKRNKQAFARYIPALSPTIEALCWYNLGVFCNRNGQFNVVDKLQGRTLYGIDPKAEIEQQYQNRLANAPVINFEDPDSILGMGLRQPVDALVVLGIGLGFHLHRVITSHTLEHCIIYEPEQQYFFASLLCFDWQHLLKYCHEKKVALYFQIGEDASNIVSDLGELREHCPVKRAAIYKHYNIPTFNAIERELRTQKWQVIKSSGLPWGKYTNARYELPLWSSPTTAKDWLPVDNQQHDGFQRNMRAFERYFPDIAKQFHNYTPERWCVVENADGQINLSSLRFPESYYGDGPKEEGALNYETFAKYPNRDGLVLGYDGTKLKQYTHYKFVSATELLIDELEERQSALPETIKALILFGLGNGYQLDALNEGHQVENLFICEPEPDFFYASLFAIDWERILTEVDERDARIYINIGDNGTHLFRDLISQFYAIGPYVLVNTFFYQSYYRPDLVEAVNQLREQLQVVIALGECYDHARYGIAHTVELINRGTPFLRANPSQHLSFETKETPVFIVGNGPSLDQSLDIIKEHSEQAIIVSCGTALQVLYKNNIVPDFHAEIEQNRSTFDWVTRSSTKAFTEQITLISCNGLHPDTADLFKGVLLAFKEGESSTVSNLNILNSNDWQKLEFAFPTVTNFVLNLYLELNFAQLYLMGVDLGFLDDKTHHSKQSGYYDGDGKELYDYAEKNQTNIRVPGNFKPAVFTKYEFKVSKEIMEQSLQGTSVECFNCSDGVRIAGTTPLTLDNVLLMSNQEQKQSAIQEIQSKAYLPVCTASDYKLKFRQKYQHDVLTSELAQYEELIDQTLNQELSLDELLIKQKTLLHDSYQGGRSLLFYLLYGTSNYANAVLSKLQLAINSDKVSDSHLSKELNQALELWRDTIRTIQSEYINFPNAYDFAYSMHFHRENALLQSSTDCSTTYAICDAEFSGKLIKWFNFFSPKDNNCDLILQSRELNPGEKLIVLIREPHKQSVLAALNGVLEGSTGVRVFAAIESLSTLNELRMHYPQHQINGVYCDSPIRDEEALKSFHAGERPFSFDEVSIAKLTRASLMTEDFGLLIPKVKFTCERKDVQSQYQEQLLQDLSDYEFLCDFPDFILAAHKADELVLKDGVGNRGRPFHKTDMLIHPFKPTMQEKTVSQITQQFYERQVGGFPLD